MPLRGDPEGVPGTGGVDREDRSPTSAAASARRWAGGGFPPPPAGYQAATIIAADGILR
jgi:hypothetical protein